MPKPLFVALASAALALLAGAGGAVAQNPPATVRVGLDVDAGTLDPRLARDTSAYRVADLIYDGLVRLSPDLKPEPNLAQSWENPDPQTWIFKLRDGVTFHDGTPLTADDVVFTYQTILKPEMNAPSAGPVHADLEGRGHRREDGEVHALDPLLAAAELSRDGHRPEEGRRGRRRPGAQADRHRPDEARALGPRQPDRA